MREALTWGTCGVLLLLVAALTASDGPSWVQAPFLLCAAGLALVRGRYGTVPRRALLAATGILGLGMSLYGVLGLAYVSPWGAWWLSGDSCSRRRPGGVYGYHAVPAGKDRRT